jgi:hypothetical protein
VGGQDALRHHLLHEGISATLDLVGGQLLDPLAQDPDVPEGVTQPGHALTAEVHEREDGRGTDGLDHKGGARARLRAIAGNGPLSDPAGMRNRPGAALRGLDAVVRELALLGYAHCQHFDRRPRLPEL